LKSVESQLNGIMRDVKHSDPHKRYHALHALHELGNTDDLEIPVILLEEMIVCAKGPFPEPVEDWDDPSYYLLNFVFNFRTPELVEATIKHFSHFSPSGKELAFEYLCSFESEKCEMALYEILEGELKESTFEIPWPMLYEQSAIIKRLIQNHYTYLDNEKYSGHFFRFLLFTLEHGMLGNFKTSYVLPLLMDKYQKVKEKYNEYDDSYSPDLVYRFWKGNYLSVRSDMHVYLSLMEYYYNDEIKELLQEALTFKDTTIKTIAAISCLQRNIEVPEHILIECATNIESTELLYYELEKIRKEHLFPIKTNKQPLFARGHLFRYLTRELEISPKNINVADRIETENAYGQPIRFYLLSFENENDEKFAAWVGAYALEEDDDTIHMWDGTYTDFVPFDRYSIEEHKQQFFDKRKKRQEEDNEEVHFSNEIRFTWKHWLSYIVLYLFVAIRWLTFPLQTGIFSKLITFVITAFAIILTIDEQKKRKQHILLQGRMLKYLNGRDKLEVPLHHIRKIVIENRRDRNTILKGKKPHVVIYSHGNEEMLAFPMNYVNYEYFSMIVHGLTNHLKEPPYIEMGE